jgi:uncharacterized protein
MTQLVIEDAFPRGLLRPELFLGVASSVTARTVDVNLSEAGHPSGSHFAGGRYGRGEVGEFVLVEGQQSLLLGRIAAVLLHDQDRRSIRRDFAGDSRLDAVGQVQLLGCVSMDSLLVVAGVDAYPRIGDRVYAAPHRFIALLPRLMERLETDTDPVTLNIGSVDSVLESNVEVKPERLFGRHCAILGATGGGKSWTTARIIEECLRHEAKLILIDATAEYRDFAGPSVRHCHLGEPVAKATGSIASSLPPTSFMESDFVALFEPAGKVQGPKLRAAVRSLKLAGLEPTLAPNGFILKIDRSKAAVEAAERVVGVSSRLDDPRQPFDVTKLVAQIEQECVYPDGFLQGGARGAKDPTKWGDASGDFSYCLSLVSRINGVLASPAFAPVFAAGNKPSVTAALDLFLGDKCKLLRICVSGIAFEYQARQVIANVIGRYLLSQARTGMFLEKPAVVLIDEAHHFLGRQVGSEDHAARLDAFELIAKEGRKYGLCICLVSQRPRDITEGVLSQMGTLIVHRLTNDQDRSVVERACGELDRSSAAFLPNLRPGQAAIIGADFPIPLTIQIHEPSTRPKSESPNYQKHWAAPAADVLAEAEAANIGAAGAAGSVAPRA